MCFKYRVRILTICMNDSEYAQEFNVHQYCQCFPRGILRSSPHDLRLNLRL